MAELTNQEVGLVDELRKRLDSILTEEEQRQPRFLIRWVRARSGNLDAAEKMLKEALRWREEHGLERILMKDFPPSVYQLAPYHILGRDREGRPVVEVHFGKWDIKTLSNLGETEFFDFTNQFLERVMQAIAFSRKDSNDNAYSSGDVKFTQATWILDMNGYSYSQLANVRSLQNTLKLAGKYEAYYPEVMAACLVINAPTIFSMLYALVKPLLAPATVAKVTVFGADRASWGPVVDSFVEQDQIGPEFGGTAIRSLP